MMSKLIILLYVLATSSALVLLKLGSTNGAPISFIGSRLVTNFNLVIILGGMLYVTSFLLYTYLISRYDLGYIIPLGTGIVYVLVFLASLFVFKESFTLYKLLGIILIVAGLVFLNIKSK